MAGFHVNVLKLKYFLTRDSFSAKDVDRTIKAFVDNKMSSKAVATDDTKFT